jgi:hypothetical protein
VYTLHTQMPCLYYCFKLRDFSPQANYTDRATVACRRMEGVTWSTQRIPTAVNLGFPDRSPYFLEIAPQLSSRGWVVPVPDPLLLIKSGSAGNLTRDLWICTQELRPLDHRGGHGMVSSNKVLMNMYPEGFPWTVITINKCQLLPLHSEEQTISNGS